MFRFTSLQVPVLIVVLSVLNPATPVWATMGPPGLEATYAFAGDGSLPASVVARFKVTLGETETWDGVAGQWLHMEAKKRNGETFQVWVLGDGYPPESLQDSQQRVLRYLLARENANPVAYQHAVTGRAVLPGSGGWPYLFPRPAPGESGEDIFPASVELLGHTYQREQRVQGAPVSLPANARVHHLRPDVLTGVPHNTRQADETRRYDDSEYEYIPLASEDFDAMIAAGLNSFHAAPSLVDRFEAAGVFYWGVGGVDVAYPECLYQPLYIGPSLFLDEPAVVTRDSVLRPRLREEASFRRDITPQLAMEAFEAHYAHVIAEGAPQQLMRGMAARDDVDLGTMQFVQPNLYSWETMVSSAAHQLLYDAATPGAIVFEPPGQLGTRRTVPAWNMSYGCQIPVTGRDHFIDIIIGYLRGAARASGKEWGISIYGGVDRTESPAFISRAYELGATRFFYWDSARLACVPFGEVLDLTRHLTAQAREYPSRDLARLREAGEVALLFPPGYNLGHVQMGKGMLWGVPELNLERLNREGVAYRTVMGKLFTEIERCLRQGVAFDLLWDLPELQVPGYREVVRIREDGRVEVTTESGTQVLDGPRVPERPEGKAPELEVTLAEHDGVAPCVIEATAHVVEGDALVYYAPSPDDSGVHPVRQVLWELYGPNEEDYAHRAPEILGGVATSPGPGQYVVQAKINIARPGAYRLRAATTDLAGRSTVVWRDLRIR